MTISATTQGLRPGVCLSTARPASPFEGQMIYETDTDVLAIWNGTAWRQLAAATPTNGTVLRVVSVTKTDTFTHNTSTFTDITGLTATITPYSASNKIMVMATVSTMHATGLSEVYLRLARGGTAISVGDAAGVRERVTSYVSDVVATIPLMHLDSPASTSSLTYSVQTKTGIANNAYVNRTYADANSFSGPRATSTITLMEIAG